MNFQLLSLPLRGADLHPMHEEPAASVEPAEQAEAEVDVVVQMALQAHEALHARVEPDVAAHGMKNARLDGMGSEPRVGLKMQMPPSVFHGHKLIEKRIRQEREYSPNPSFILEVGASMGSTRQG